MTKGKRRRKRENAKRAAERRRADGLAAGPQAEGNGIEEDHTQTGKQEPEEGSQMPTNTNKVSEWIRE